MSVENTQDAAITTQATTGSLPTAPDSIQSTFTSLVPMLLIFVVFYFLLIRPQEKKRKAQEQLVSTAKPGEEVVLHSGLYGKIVKVNENDSTINVQIAENTEVKVMQSAIAEIISRKKAVETTKAQDTKAAVEDKSKKKGKK